MFRKIFFILIGLLFLASPVIAADWYVDTNCANDGDGTVHGCAGAPAGAGAWNDITSYNIASGDTLWIRRTSSQVMAADWDLDNSASASPQYMHHIGWPRTTASGTADVFNGLAGFVDLSITGDREKHSARMVKNDTDGFEYLITAIGYYVIYDGWISDFVVGETIDDNEAGFSGVVHSVVETTADTDGIVIFKPGYTGALTDNDVLDSGGNKRADAQGAGEVVFIIDRPYAGSDAANGNFTILADDDYTDRSSEGTVRADWDGDAHDLPLIDFNDGDFNVDNTVTPYNYTLKNIEFKDSTDANGILYVKTSRRTFIQGCLFKQSTQNDPLITINDALIIIDRTILEGSHSANGNQDGLVVGYYGSSLLVLTNSAIYGCGNNAISGMNQYAYSATIHNVNLGIEVANSDDDICIVMPGMIKARDLNIGGTNGYFDSSDTNTSLKQLVSVNNGKVLGAYKEWINYGWTNGGGTNEPYVLEKKAVTAVTPNKKLSDNILELTPPTASGPEEGMFSLDHRTKVYESRKTYDTGTYNIKVWIYNDTGNTLNDTTFSDDICMRCRAEAGNYGDANTEYVSMPWTYSDEIDILDAADANDWDFLQCDSMVVDHTDSKIYCEILISTYDADADCIYIDPEVVDTDDTGLTTWDIGGVIHQEQGASDGGGVTYPPAPWYH
jgi:antitoxin component YwqK of YwqJK toxin-antitoxin module